MTQSTLDYLKGRVKETHYINAGEITTSVTVVLDNGYSVSGSSVRDISSFNTEEAQQAAYNNAVASLVPGVSFVLTNA